MQKTNNNEIGEIGEGIACKFLIKERYKILFRNYREKFDEIDIIAKSFEGILVFIEVKTLKIGNAVGLIPEDNLTKEKFRRISRACRLFAASHEELFDVSRGWRIDLIAITLDGGKAIWVDHYKNITTEQ
jgi:putative endonuclease